MSHADTPLTAARRALRAAFRAAFIMSMFINLTLFVTPIYSMQIYDRVLSSRNTSTLLMLTLIAVVFLALYGLLEYVRHGVLTRAGARFNEVLSGPLYDAVLRARLGGREMQASLSLKDAEVLREGISSGIITSLFDTPWSIAFIGLCYLLHPVLGQVALIGAIAILACALFSEYATRKAIETITRRTAEKSRFVESSLRNAEAVQGLGMGEAIRRHWQALDHTLIAAHTTSGERSAALLGLSKSVRMGVQISLLGMGAWLAIDREISPGAMLAAMIIMGRALAPVEHAVAHWKRITTCRSAYRRLEALFASFPVRPTGTELPEPKGDLSVEDLALVSPKGGSPILRSVSFAVASGTSLAVIGPSGSGKSSLARALAGVWLPTKGAVRLDQAALDQWNASALGKLIGYLPQEVEFLPGTVARNIARLGPAVDAEVIGAAKAAGVHETILRLPKGYETEIGEGGVVLSGGQRQRLGLARALYGKPRLIILDEPNSNLDAEGELALAEAIQTMKSAGQTVVIVTHKPQILRHVEKVLVLANGTVKSFGDRDDVLAKVATSKVSALTERTPALHAGPQTSKRATDRISSAQAQAPATAPVMVA
jgi:ATP-binding cassette subfamily C protein/ATP-binding cassette subfamily C protein EexD